MKGHLLFRYASKIQISVSVGSWASGVLIGNGYILTVAHALHLGEPGAALKVSLQTSCNVLDVLQGFVGYQDLETLGSEDYLKVHEVCQLASICKLSIKLETYALRSSPHLSM